MWSMSMRAGQWGGQREGGFAHAQVQAVNMYRLTPRSLAYPLCGLGNVPWSLCAPFPLMWSQATATPYTQRWAPGSAGAGSTKPANSGHPRAPGDWGSSPLLSSCPLPPEQMSSGGPRPQASKQSWARPYQIVLRARGRGTNRQTPPRVMAMGSYFCRKEDSQPCWTQTWRKREGFARHGSEGPARLAERQQVMGPQQAGRVEDQCRGDPWGQSEKGEEGPRQASGDVEILGPGR